MSRFRTVSGRALKNSLTKLRVDTRTGTAQPDELALRLKRLPVSSQRRFHERLTQEAALIGGASTTFAADDVFRVHLYKPMRDLSIRLLSTFPPSHYFYVCVGRSPAPVSAFLRELVPGQTIDMPVSGLRDQKVKNGSTVAAVMGNARAAFHRRLLEHFPTKRELNGRTALLIDFMQSGQTLANLRTELTAALGAAGRTHAIEAAALGTGTEQSWFQNPLPKWLHTLRLVDGPPKDQAPREHFLIESAVGSAFWFHQWRDVARFGETKFDDPAPAKLNGKANLSLRKEVRNGMRSDEDLRHAVTEMTD
jgi:hypothetical protein